MHVIENSIACVPAKAECVKSFIYFFKSIVRNRIIKCRDAVWRNRIRDDNQTIEN